ncbi:hypothetical protein [Actinoplanes campanulatus]|uniref:hypothetical protein n=1 Tax=Actinoplanes campanulatus TaxID=113559 RepID=UPI00195474DD|nr:hypothetical protein [Actinoplanes capillaceus]
MSAVDFMFGASDFKQIEEAAEYTTVLLSLVLPDGTPVTLTRSTSGGKINVHNGDHSSVPTGAADYVLLAKAAGKSKAASISSFLLDRLQLGDRRLRKNERGETVSFTLRHVMNLCLVDETKMQAETPPPLTGQVVSRTADISALRLMLDGVDDSQVIPAPNPVERRISKGKAEVLDQVIADLESAIEGSPGVQDLQQTRARLEQSMAGETETITGILTRRDEARTRRDAFARAVSQVRAREQELAMLIARFGLLIEKYDSDVARLDMVREAGTLLGYFQPGVCVFCGAAVEHQEYEDHALGESTALADAVNAEIRKTAELRADLTVTIDDMGRQVEQLATEAQDLEAQRDGVDSEISVIEEELLPRRVVIEQSLQQGQQIERMLAAHAQIEKMRELQARVLPEPAAPLPQAPTVSNTTRTRLSDHIRETLTQWELPAAGEVVFNFETNDVYAQGKPRSSRGKGIRAILHAAFTVGLAEYCFANDRPHPGFIVLDSPLVTYREPGTGRIVPESDEPVSSSVAAAFFRALSETFAGQAVVVENTTPPERLNSEASVRYEFFTGRVGEGRFGFFPTSPTATE